MVWIFAAVILLLAALAPGFRKFAPLCLAALLGVYFLLAFMGGSRTRAPGSDNSQARPTAERVLGEAAEQHRAPAKMLSPTLVHADDIRTNASFVNGSGRVSLITARIHNDAEHDTLASIDFRLTIQDCRNPAPRARQTATDCTRVHEQTGSIAATILPRQAGDVQIMLHAPPWDEVHLLGTAQVGIDITAAQAQ